MQLSRIITNRKIDPHHANDLVYEWEDDLREYFGAPLYYNQAIKNERYSKYIPLLLNWLQTSEPAFTYEMCTYRHNGNNKRNVVPCIIDFYIRKPWQVKLWYAQYWRNPAICVSSREVYEYIQSILHSDKIHHLPLSLSDRYKITPDTRFEKKYDLLIAGRQNPVLKEYLTRYLNEHPDTTFVRRDFVDGKAVYVDHTGACISPTDSRDIYINMMRSARACMYSTPGIDGSRRTNGFSQVTPHFLEIIAAGCHPLLRYPKNADTDFYELPSLGEHLATYEQFCKALDRARREPVDMNRYSRYMQAHYTSAVANQLRQILQRL